MLRRLIPLIAAALPAVLASAASGATSEATVTVTGGSLGLTTPAFDPLSAMLTGQDQVVTTQPGSPWSAVDARGTGAAWSVVATATDLVSTGSPDRVIPSAGLALTTGAVTAGSGADPASGITGSTAAPFTVPTGPGATAVTVLNAPGAHRGTYEITPTLAVTLPATVQPSYAGQPYTATLTVTIS